MLKQGDNVFYCGTGEGEVDYFAAALRTIQACGLTPLAYSNTGLEIKKSTLDREMRDDLYQSKVLVVLLVKEKDGESIKDNWALPELTHIIASGIRCFFYITSEITQEETKELNLPIEAIIVENEKNFETILKQSLQELLTD